MARLMDDEELAVIVINGFLEDVPRQIVALRSHLEEGDASGAALQAHTIKGASANLGGERLASVAHRMEQAASSGNLPGASGLLEALETEFHGLRQAMLVQGPQALRLSS